jgi:2-oxoacid:acceptor oxidoreductase gamma subunit (pyruvate/2-ketoisovalerate family)
MSLPNQITQKYGLMESYGGKMLLVEVRWHGRGGQGIVTVSRLLAHAALLDGKHVQAFPEFGPERRGAPVTGYTRISDEPITIHSHIYNPNIVVIVDPTLLGSIDVTNGLVEDGTIIANSERTASELKKSLKVEKAEVYTVNATRIAHDILGRPIYNTAMLGALVKAAPLVKLESIDKVVKERFPGTVGEKNVAVIKKAFEEAKRD